MARHVARTAEPRDGPPRAALSASRTVLVVAGDSARGGEMVGALQRRGFPTVQGSSAAQALYWARREPPALVILDVDKVDGVRRLLHELRKRGQAVLALSDDSQARAWALEAGCLDASSPGLEADELALKVSALLGRRRGIRADRIEAGPLMVDLSTRRLAWRGREISASPLLLELAAYLATHAGRIVPTRVLLEEVWGEPWADPNKVHQAIWRLRRRLGERTYSALLVGRQGHGYGLLLDAPPISARRRAAGL